MRTIQLCVPRRASPQKYELIIQYITQELRTEAGRTLKYTGEDVQYLIAQRRKAEDRLRLLRSGAGTG